MCYESDGLVFFSMEPSILQGAVSSAKAASQRPLEVKPYASDFSQWLQKVIHRYPHEAWTVLSKFPWSSVRASWRSAREYMKAMELLAMDEDRHKGKKIPMPETDMARLISVSLEATTIIG